MAKNWDMHKLAFQALKRTFMHVSRLPPSIVWWKTKLCLNSFFKSKYVGEDFRHAQTCVSEPETHFHSCLRSSPTIFWFKKQMYKVFGFSSKYALGGRPETCINVRFRLWNATYAYLSSSPTIFHFKKQFIKYLVSLDQNKVGKDLRHA